MSYGPSGYYGPPAGAGDGYHVGSAEYSGWPAPPLLGHPDEFTAMPVLVVVESVQSQVGGGPAAGEPWVALGSALATTSRALTELAAGQRETMARLSHLAEQVRSLQESLEMLHGHLDEWRAQQGDA